MGQLSKREEVWLRAYVARANHFKFLCSTEESVKDADECLSAFDERFTVKGKEEKK